MIFKKGEGIEIFNLRSFAFQSREVNFLFILPESNTGSIYSFEPPPKPMMEFLLIPVKTGWTKYLTEIRSAPLLPEIKAQQSSLCLPFSPDR